MSREDVEVVRQVYDAAGRRDAAAVFALNDADVEWDASRTQRGALTGQVARGREALLTWLREWYEVWETVDDSLEELIDASEHGVISVMVQRGRGRASGVEVEDRVAAVWTIRDGKVVRLVAFPSREDALEAVGLRD